MLQCLKVSPMTADDNRLSDDIERVKQVVSGVRMVRNQKVIAPKEKMALQVVSTNFYEAYSEVIMKMANLSSLTVVDAKPADAAQFMVGTD